MLKENIMTEILEIEESSGGSIKVGTTGTVGTLMSKELESTKQMPQASSSSSRRKPQTGPVSIPCGFIPKKPSQRKSPSTDPGGCSNSNAACSIPDQLDKPKQKTRKNGNAAMLDTEDIITDRNPTRGSKPDKKRHSYIAEVVDVKCSNPMSSRLKKMGFSKLSESSA